MKILLVDLVPLGPPTRNPLKRQRRLVPPDNNQGGAKSRETRRKGDAFDAFPSESRPCWRLGAARDRKDVPIPFSNCALEGEMI